MAKRAAGPQRAFQAAEVKAKYKLYYPR